MSVLSRIEGQPEQDTLEPECQLLEQELTDVQDNHWGMKKALEAAKRIPDFGQRLQILRRVKKTYLGQANTEYNFPTSPRKRLSPAKLEEIVLHAAEQTKEQIEIAGGMCKIPEEKRIQADLIIFKDKVSTLINDAELQLR